MHAINTWFYQDLTAESAFLIHNGTILEVLNQFVISFYSQLLSYHIMIGSNKFIKKLYLNTIRQNSKLTVISVFFEDHLLNATMPRLYKFSLQI